MSHIIGNIQATGCGQFGHGNVNVQNTHGQIPVPNPLPNLQPLQPVPFHVNFGGAEPPQQQQQQQQQQNDCEKKVIENDKKKKKFDEIVSIDGGDNHIEYMNLDNNNKKK
eukprot:149404_1